MYRQPEKTNAIRKITGMDFINLSKNFFTPSNVENDANKIGIYNNLLKLTDLEEQSPLHDLTNIADY